MRHPGFRWGLLAAATLLVLGQRSPAEAPPKAVRLPLGLRWGLSPKGATKALPKSFKQRSYYLNANRGNAEAVYDGTFEKLPTQAIKLEFCQGKLALVEILVADQAQPPLERRWNDLLERVRAQYGPPQEGGKPSGLTDERLRSAILDGQEPLSATWSLPDQTRLFLGTWGNDRDAQGHRGIALRWGFIHDALEAACDP